MRLRRPQRPTSRPPSRAGGGRGPFSQRGTRGLLFSSFIDSFGNGLFLADSVLYLTRSVELSNAQVTLGLTAAGLVGFLTTVPVSMLGDRMGAQRLLVILQLWRMVGFSAYAFIDSFAHYLAVAVFIAVSDRVAQPVLQAVVGNAVGEEHRVSAMAWIRSTRNAGLAAGALVTSFAVAADTMWAYRTIILGDAATFLASGILLCFLRLPRQRRADSRGTAPPHALRVLRTLAGERRYLLLTLLNGVLSLHTTLLAVGVPLWISQRTDLPAAAAPVLIAVNTVLAFVLQPLAARGAFSLARAARCAWWGACSLAIGCVLFASAPHFGLIAAGVLVSFAVVCHTMGEIWQTVGAWEISYELAPEDRRGAYLGVFSLGPTGAQIVGPTAVAIGVVGLGPPGWAALAVVFLLSGLAVRAACRRTHPAQPTPAGTSTSGGSPAKPDPEGASTTG